MINIDEPCICASRGRPIDNPNSRESGLETSQRIEINISGCSNCLTTVQKDNWVFEPCVLTKQRNEYGKQIRKDYESGLVSEKISNMNDLVPRTDGLSNTLTTVQKDNYVFEPKLEFIGSINDKDWVGDGKHLSRNSHQGDRVYSSDGISASITSKGGGVGGSSGLYAIKIPTEWNSKND